MRKLALILLSLLPASAFAEDKQSVAALVGERSLILFGKLHPIVVHFPIALIMFAALLESWSWLRRRSSPLDSARLALCFGALASIAASGFGWLNAAYQDFQGDLVDILFIHRWGGISVTVLALASAYLALRATRLPTKSNLLGYRVSTILTTIVIGAIAHFGGLMVHGPDYYSEVFDLSDTRFATEADRAKGTDDRRAAFKSSNFSADSLPAPSTEKVDYVRDIHPILDDSCARCHANGKSKGKFNMDTRDAFIAGGETGPAVEVGRSDKSYLIELVTGVHEKKVMPNKGRRLTNLQVGLLRAWIDQGLKWDDKIESNHVRVAKVPTTPRRPEIAKLASNELPSTYDISNPIDQIVGKYFVDHKFTPPALVDDRTYIRRVTLDLHGVLPDGNATEKFIADKSPDKRAKLVDALLADNHKYSVHWMTFWNDALRNDYTGTGFLHGGREEVTSWLYNSLMKNMPFDEFARQLASPSRDSRGFIHGIRWWKSGVVNANEEPAMQAAQNISQLFMGINMKCASCHDSFTDDWKLEDSYGVANVYANHLLETHECNVPNGKFTNARFVYPELGSIPQTSLRNRRKLFANLLTSNGNGRFARTYVNRLWERFFGTGIVERVDEMDNPPWSGDLVDWLASELVRQGYDSKKMMRLILTSSAYQLPSVGAFERREKDFVFHGPVVRRMNVEQFVDSFNTALDVEPDAQPGDIQRIIATELAQPNLEPGGPQILFRSGAVTAASGKKEFDVNLQGAKSVWLVTLRRYEVKSRLDQLRDQFDRVQQSDDGLADSLSASLKGNGARARYVLATSKKARKEKRAEVSQTYRAVWSDPRLIMAKAEVALSSAQIPDKKLYIDDDDAEEITSAEQIGTVAAHEPTAKPMNEIEFSGEHIVTRAFSAIKIPVTDLNAIRFKGAVSVEADVGSDRAVEFLVVKDLNVRSVFREASRMLLALGRPLREQIVTRRNSVATTMEALELSNAPELMKMVTNAANDLERHHETREQTVDYVYRQLLNRLPTDKEREITRELFRTEKPNEALQTLVWGIIVLPEYQLIT